MRKKIGLPISERALLDYDLNDDAQHKFVNGVNFSKAETSAQSERINPDPAGDSSDEEERTEV